MKVLITGACGYLGGTLPDCFAAKGHQPIALIRSQESIGKLSSYAEVRAGNLSDEAYLFRAMEDIDVVVHLAGRKGYRECEERPYEAVVSNVLFTERLTRAGGRRRIPFLLASTYWVYGIGAPPPFRESLPPAPCEVYGWTKALAEKIVIGSGLPFKIVRLSNVFGFGKGAREDEVVSLFLKKAIRGEPIRLHNAGRHRIDLLFIDDACRVLAEVAERGAHNRILNLGSGRGTSIAELACVVDEISERNAGKKPEIIVGGPEDDPVQCADRWMDIRLIQETLDFTPTPLPAAVEKFYRTLCGLDA